MKIYCLKNVALLARKRQLVIDLMSNVLLDEIVGEPLQGKVPELHPSGAHELTHGVYSVFVTSSLVFCAVILLLSLLWSLYSLSFFDLWFSVIPWFLQTFLPDPIQ